MMLFKSTNSDTLQDRKAKLLETIKDLSAQRKDLLVDAATGDNAAQAQLRKVNDSLANKDRELIDLTDTIAAIEQREVEAEQAERKRQHQQKAKEVLKLTGALGKKAAAVDKAFSALAEALNDYDSAADAVIQFGFVSGTAANTAKSPERMAYVASHYGIGVRLGIDRPGTRHDTNMAAVATKLINAVETEANAALKG